MPIRKTLYFIAFLLLIVANSPVARAGFGISPPYFSNDSLTRGSHYDKKIIIVRGEGEEDWNAKVTINVPGADNWIKVDRGTDFTFPKGETQMPINVSVDVPADADFEQYKGNITVVTSPSSGAGTGGGAISIALGGQIDVDLNVLDKKIEDFVLRGISVKDVEEGRKWLFWFIPAKVEMSLKIENIGNIPTTASKVELDILDANQESILETTSTNKLPKVKSFETKEVLAKIPTKLSAGSYWINFRVFKGDQIVDKGEGQLHLSIVKAGELGKSTITLDEVPLAAWLTFAALLAIVGLGVWFLVRKFKTRR